LAALKGFAKCFYILYAFIHIFNKLKLIKTPYDEYEAKKIPLLGISKKKNKKLKLKATSL
jgi:hypothetical protein